MSWLSDSIMYQRGVAHGQVTTTHMLTEAVQGTYHYTIGPYSTPVLRVAPGDRILVETRDTFEGKIQTERDLPTQVLRMPFVNPQNGPILVEGAAECRLGHPVGCRLRLHGRCVGVGQFLTGHPWAWSVNYDRDQNR